MTFAFENTSCNKHCGLKVNLKHSYFVQKHICSSVLLFAAMWSHFKRARMTCYIHIFLVPCQADSDTTCQRA